MECSQLAKLVTWYLSNWAFIADNHPEDKQAKGEDETRCLRAVDHQMWLPILKATTLPLLWNNDNASVCWSPTQQMWLS